MFPANDCCVNRFLPCPTTEKTIMSFDYYGGIEGCVLCFVFKTIVLNDN